MQTPRRRWRLAFGVFAALALAFVLALRTERAGAFVCAELRDRLPAAINASVEVGHCAIDPLNGSVEVSRISEEQRAYTKHVMTIGTTLSW